MSLLVVESAPLIVALRASALGHLPKGMLLLRLLSLAFCVRRVVGHLLVHVLHHRSRPRLLSSVPVGVVQLRQEGAQLAGEHLLDLVREAVLDHQVVEAVVRLGGHAGHLAVQDRVDAAEPVDLDDVALYALLQFLVSFLALFELLLHCFMFFDKLLV